MSSWVNGNLKGSLSIGQGERGPQGVQGPKGETGPQGPIGEQGLQGLPGRDGKNGADGYTPIKGTDYYTKEDKEELITEVLKRIPNGNEVAY